MGKYFSNGIWIAYCHGFNKSQTFKMRKSWLKKNKRMKAIVLRSNDIMKINIFHVSFIYV